jgi:haloalkane dehalogenase
MGFATKHPQSIQSISILNTAAFRSKRIPLRIRLCRTPILGDLLVRGLNAFARAALFMAVTNKMGTEIDRCYLYPYNTWQNRIATLRFVQDIPLSQKDASYSTLVEIENKLHLLSNIPMLLCWGGKDFCFTEHYYREWKRRFPKVLSHYFPDAGHYVLEDAFDRIGPLVKEFITSKTK